MHKPQPDDGYRAMKPILRRVALLLAAGAWLASCNTPVGVAPELQGTYKQNALVTNPNGGGPQVVRWGPPEPWNAQRD